MKKLLFKKITQAAISVCIAITSVPFSTAAADTADTKLIALTFDDGPNTTTTLEVLDVLEEYNAKGSFFLIGNNINEESAQSVKHAYEMGCEIDNHSRSHPNMGGMTADAIKEEVNYVDEKVYEIIGEYPKFFRPPFIDTSQTMYDNIEIPFICGIDCQDYMENVTAQQRADYILNGAKDGTIVLLHDAAGNSQTVEALKIAIPQLMDQGYEFVTLTELFERQGEKPKRNMIYTYVAKYPLKGYTQYKNVFSGEATGEPSWSGWHDTAVLDRDLLEELGDTYAIEVNYSCEHEPVIALQKWSDGASIWQPIYPSYFNGDKAVFLASDIREVLDSLGVSCTALDRMTVTPNWGTMTITSVDILTKGEADTPEKTVPGDVNDDGKFNVADLVSLDNWLLGKNEKLKNSSAGDLCKDDKLDVYDLVVMRQMLTA